MEVNSSPPFDFGSPLGYQLPKPAMQINGQEMEVISGYSIRLQHVLKRFEVFLADQEHLDGIRGVVAWLFRCARSSGIEDCDAVAIIQNAAARDTRFRDSLLVSLQTMTEPEISVARDRPELPIGQRVSVIVNARNLTPHEGTVTERVWHPKEQCWMYFMEEGGKEVPKRYYARDFDLLFPSPGA